MYYILDENKQPIKENDVIKWGNYIETRRIVKQEQIGKVFVSTVFLGIDHNFFGGTPVLFETMVFDGKYDDHQWRYATWDDALKGHNEIVKMVKQKPIQRKRMLERARRLICY